MAFDKLLPLLSKIAGRRAWIVRGSPTAPHAAAGMLVVHRYNPELEEIGGRFDVLRHRGEHDRDFAFRVATEIASRLHALQRDLDRVININRQ